MPRCGDGAVRAMSEKRCIGMFSFLCMSVIVSDGSWVSRLLNQQQHSQVSAARALERAEWAAAEFVHEAAHADGSRSVDWASCSQSHSPTVPIDANAQTANRSRPRLRR